MPVMEVGTQFSNVSEFRNALRQHCILNEFVVNYIKNDKVRVTTQCQIRDCPWRIHASVTQDKVTFEVKNLMKEHTCTSINKVGNEMASSGWLSSMIVSILHKTPELGASKMKMEIEQKYNLSLPYGRVLAARGKAVELIHGKASDSFRLVPELQQQLMQSNPGSIVKYLLDVDHSFMRFFVCLYACSQGFISGCRPFFGLDGCHLKGRYKGILLSATSLDGNGNLFPLAFAVVESESRETWKWFLEGLHEAIVGMVEGLALMSDRDKGLEAAVLIVFPMAEHRTCVRHLYKNFKKKHPGELFERLIWLCANSYNLVAFESHMMEIRTASASAAAYLDAIKDQVWSRHQFRTAAMSHYLTNNISESFNAWINKARQLHIVELVDTIRGMIMVRMNHRRCLGKKWKGKLVPKAFRYVQQICKEKGSYIVRRSSDMKAEVVGPYHTCVVNLEDKTCSCRAWQVSGLPCEHAATFITSVRGLDISDFVDDCYSVQKFRSAYAIPVGAMPGKELWHRVKLPFVVGPPKTIRP
ncbi:hypothetical protein QJS04_geneDACA012903 [Acorus gramineus]|uniref:SWIM-type domain-containing protein n=1 Tax=Acorus gramineus TaxID=55184 RepID=A0AAV9BIS4_ACOGR|nr:hypothetical protein QJS04_geneDACA012903 [Acorus gramineus]